MIISVHQYLDRAENMLLDKRSDNATVDIDRRRFPARGNRTVVLFRARVAFESAHLLMISDHFLIEPSGEKWSRKCSYFFGAPNGDEIERLFLFDNHGEFGHVAHLDLGNDERLYEGDPRLNGFSPEDVDIIDICGFIDQHFNGHPFPWVAP